MLTLHLKGFQHRQPRRRQAQIRLLQQLLHVIVHEGDYTALSGLCPDKCRVLIELTQPGKPLESSIRCCERAVQVVSRGGDKAVGWVFVPEGQSSGQDGDFPFQGNHLKRILAQPLSDAAFRTHAHIHSPFLHRHQRLPNRYCGNAKRGIFLVECLHERLRKLFGRHV